jgi:hypothetical protein
MLKAEDSRATLIEGIGGGNRGKTPRSAAKMATLPSAAVAMDGGDYFTRGI